MNKELQEIEKEYRASIDHTNSRSRLIKLALQQAKEDSCSKKKAIESLQSQLQEIAKTTTHEKYALRVKKIKHASFSSLVLSLKNKVTRLQQQIAKLRCQREEHLKKMRQMIYRSKKNTNSTHKSLRICNENPSNCVYKVSQAATSEHLQYNSNSKSVNSTESRRITQNTILRNSSNNDMKPIKNQQAQSKHHQRISSNKIIHSIENGRITQKKLPQTSLNNGTSHKKNKQFQSDHYQGNIQNKMIRNKRGTLTKNILSKNSSKNRANHKKRKQAESTGQQRKKTTYSSLESLNVEKEKFAKNQKTTNLSLKSIKKSFKTTHVKNIKKDTAKADSVSVQHKLNSRGHRNIHIGFKRKSLKVIKEKQMKKVTLCKDSLPDGVFESIFDNFDLQAAFRE